MAIFNHVHFFADMTRDEAYALLQSCVREVQKRLIINLPNFQVQVIDKSGIKMLEDITVKNLNWNKWPNFFIGIFLYESIFLCSHLGWGYISYYYQFCSWSLTYWARFVDKFCWFVVKSRDVFWTGIWRIDKVCPSKMSIDGILQNFSTPARSKIRSSITAAEKNLVIENTRCI